MEVGEDGAQPGEIRPMEAVPIDGAHRDDPNADGRCACTDRLEQLLALRHRYLLGVVQGGQRAHARAAQRLVVEENPRDDQRAGERAPPGLVRARYEADAELAIETEEALAAGSSHAAECTS